MPCRKRSYLLLQGVCSPFFRRLADRLAADGHQVAKINFNGGDLAYWGRRPAWSYRGRVEQFGPYLQGVIETAGVTDIVLFGDRRPLHRQVTDIAVASNVKVHVFEEGYFRPFWVTLERGGVNAHSQLPKQADWFRKVHDRLPAVEPVKAFRSPLRIRAAHDLIYHLASSINPVLFSGYRTHAPCIAPVMYAGYCRRFSLQPLHRRRDAATVAGLVASGADFFLLPLQLNSDAQIRDYSSFVDMTDVMTYVMASFARHADNAARLVIKNHPLDAGLVNYPRIIRELEQRFDIGGRVDYLETGDLLTLLRHASGVVTVNSTVGAWGLDFDCPVITLSDPIYNLPGLTFQGDLDQFWSGAQSPDRQLFRCFKDVVVQTTQLNGGFYCATGIELAVTNAIDRLTRERSLLEELL